MTSLDIAFLAIKVIGWMLLLGLASALLTILAISVISFVWEKAEDFIDEMKFKARVKKWEKGNPGKKYPKGLL